MAASIRFGVYELDAGAMELRKHGIVLRLQEQPFRVLAALLEKPGEIVSREDLKQRLWPDGTFVDFDQSLNKAVNRLRELLHDDPSQPRYIETVPRRGYRFVAPVTEDSLSSPVSECEPANSNARRHHIRVLAGLVSIAAVVVVCIGGISMYVNSRGIQQATSHRVLIDDAFSPAVSRDGKLITYVSMAGDRVPHIWARQIDGDKSIQVTSGPSRDSSPVFSHDGTQILFFSARDGGGIYTAPTFSGEAKLLVPGAYWPVISPDGRAIVCVKQARLVVLPANGGTPSPIRGVNSECLVAAPPLWSPSSEEIMFFGRKNGQSASTSRWWITSLSGSSAKRVAGSVFETVNGVQPRLYQWIASGGKSWITYSTQQEDTWNLFRVQVSRDGQPIGRAEQIGSGDGDLDGVAPEWDNGGRLIYAVTAVSAEIFQIPMAHERQMYQPAAEVPLAEGPRYYSPSVSHDGRLMAYVKVAGAARSVLLRDLANGQERVLEDGSQSLGEPAASISPDGSAVIFNRRCWCEIDIQDCPSFLIPVKGGKPEQICTNCTPRGFSSDGSFVLMQKYEPLNRVDTIIAVDLRTKQEREFLSDPSRPLYHAYLSWDDHWVVFKRLLSGGQSSQLLISPVRSGRAGSKQEWIPITDGRFSDDKPQLSPDGNTVYFTSNRDGYLCVWAQRLNRDTKHPTGPAFAVQHFHNSLGRNAAMDPDALRQPDLSVSRDKALINLPLTHQRIWVTRNN